MEGEEFACDRLAARSAPEALALARAILKARAHAAGRLSPRAGRAVPALLHLLGLLAMSAPAAGGNVPPGGSGD